MEYLKEVICEWFRPTPIVLSVVILIYAQGIRARLRKIEKMLAPFCKSD